MKLQKVGGYAAIASVCAFLIFMLKNPLGLTDPAKAMAALSSEPVAYYVSQLIFIAGTILGLITILALNERMHDNAPHLTRIATIAAFIGSAAAIIAGIAWTQAIVAIAPTKDVSAYRAFSAMTNSVWAFSGHAFGWVSLLIGCAVLKTRAFPKTPGWLLILTGIFWVRIPIPIKLGIAGFIPWILYYVSSVWFGIALLRHKQTQPAAKGMAASR
jgi:hypothetical protein